MIKDQGTLNSERVLVLAPTGRDGAAASSLLEQAGMLCKACFDIDELQRELAAGAGAALVTEEGFIGADLRLLFDWVAKQPPWSDFPFVVLTTHRAGTSLYVGSDCKTAQCHPPGTSHPRRDSRQQFTGRIAGSPAAI